MSRLCSRIVQGGFLVLFVLILVMGGVLSWPKYQQAQGLERERKRLERRIEEKTREIAAIREKRRRIVTDPEFVESLARQNRRVFPGELVFVFDD